MLFNRRTQSPRTPADTEPPELTPTNGAVAPSAPAAEPAKAEPAKNEPAEGGPAPVERIEGILNGVVGSLRDLREETSGVVSQGLAAGALAGPAVGDLRALRRDLRDTLIGMDRVVLHAATGVARSSVQMSSLTRHMVETHEAAERLADSTRQVQASAEEVTSSATEAVALATQVEQVTQAGKTVAGEAVQSIKALRGRMQDMVQHLGELVSKVEQITKVSDVIGDIASQTNLLALNAAIEAARAGQAGRGFAVVADEVRKLAENTAAQTREIGVLVQGVQAVLEPTRRAIDENLTMVNEGTAKVDATGQSLDQIDAFARETAVHMQQIAGAVEEQTATTQSVFDGLHKVATQIQAVKDETDRVSAATFKLSEVTEDAYRYLEPFRTATPFHHALQLARELGASARAVFERTVDAKRLTLDAVLEFRYAEIKGPAIQSLARLFDVSRVPREGFNPPKFSTAYDAVVDEALQKIYDEAMAKDDRLIFALILDLNAYVPIHNKVYCQKWTGDYATDNANNRVKRFFNDNQVLLRGSRMGLGARAASLSKVAGRRDFAAAGCDLREPADGDRSFLVQTYARDTGAVTSALSIPFYVKGQRWGAVFLGWSEDGSR